VCGVQRLIGRDEATVTAFCRSKRPALAALHFLCAHVPAAHAEPLLPHILSWLLSLLCAPPPFPSPLFLAAHDPLPTAPARARHVCRVCVHACREVGTNLVKLTGQVSRECASAIMAFLHQLLGTFLALPPSEYPLQVRTKEYTHEHTHTHTHTSHTHTHTQRERERHHLPRACLPPTTHPSTTAVIPPSPSLRFVTIVVVIISPEFVVWW
jgi:hypothetical protein